MYRRILVPLDGSALAAEVMPYATELASRCDSELLLLQVVATVGQVASLSVADAATLGGGTSAGVEAIAKALDSEVALAQAYLSAIANDLKEKGLKARWEVRRGKAAEQILGFAREKNVELIAISTHGRSGLSRFFMGSVTDQVLRQARLPVLVVTSGEGKKER